jgi:excisionase family DNA binding protein
MTSKQKAHPAPVAPDDTYLTMTQAADLIGVCRATIRNWVADGHLTDHRVGPRLVRIKRSDLDNTITCMTGGVG